MRADDALNTNRHSSPKRGKLASLPEWIFVTHERPDGRLRSKYRKQRAFPEPLGPRIAKFSPRRSEMTRPTKPATAPPASDTPSRCSQQPTRQQLRRHTENSSITQFFEHPGAPGEQGVMKDTCLPQRQGMPPMHCRQSVKPAATSSGIDDTGLRRGTRQQTHVILPVATSRPLSENAKPYDVSCQSFDLSISTRPRTGRRMNCTRRQLAET